MINLIKEKRNDVLKGKTCAVSSSQRLKKNESFASPVTCLESMMITLLIDAHEVIDTAIFDAPGKNIHADVTVVDKNERVVLQLTVNFADTM